MTSGDGSTNNDGGDSDNPRIKTSTTDENISAQQDQHEEPSNNVSEDDTVKAARSQNPRKSPFPRLLIQGVFHLACIVLYLVPILAPNEFAGPTLDEAHVMAGDVQKDIHDPDATWEQIFSNDYWGRPMNSPSSHKSWRPLTVLSFRYLKGPFLDLASQSLQQLTVHRFVNAVCHAAAGELVGQLATQLFVLNTNQYIDEHENAMWLQLITKVLFCLQPAHVEVTANAANRNHVLAVLLGLILCFPGTKPQNTYRGSNAQRLKITTPFWLFIVALVAGYLASETFVFMIPGIMVAMTVVSFTAMGATTVKRINLPEKSKEPEAFGGKILQLRNFIIDYLKAMISIAPRLILLVISIGLYLGGRWYFDTLDIPTGLIRPAESPYYAFEGTKRFKNYLYVVTIHLGKQWGLVLPKNFGGDPIGFSHEYGFDCIPEIQGWVDERLIFGVGFHLLLAMTISVILVAYNARQFFGLVAMHWSWTLFTLFPICGILKVGTFVSDRIVFPATVVANIWIGKIFHGYATNWFWNKNSPFRFFRPLQAIFILWWIGASYATVHNRALDWMDSVSLMNSALVTCPRFAKVHMEVSKIYSGLYPSLFDLKKSRFHLDTARNIDPDLCDLHKQYVFVALQENNYKEVERELTQALLCPFTSSGAEALWNNYWNQLLSSTPKGSRQHAEIEGRYRNAMAIVQEGILKEKAAQEAAEANKIRQKN
uniref:Uncharacterized protein n=1 Tax=Pseudo-nitzschia arenysensis TaxID=697910 RepID=A0A7R9ZTG2_9STRA|mmetsp:Transcript_108/g.266  ORF Transcript_108/g.266 Transcript_108/m.266 type:complete len:711 (+) Transcript_108:154-2286(+)|eukprot:CAMPEP_0116145910 /NCGR_PEP_ID=MMETSP0329-20121206/16877_1 /TAXON_ID=697910 /ORGANISM="Pseudo-nitzschia arenysensis, Strain B593" /LENGTH=710 /DNA_ID=CAMNT_0003641611 /DNA_START=85 /DNA_END=2217 /DNA_ORIENTATION=+